MTIEIRPYHSSDIYEYYRICLLTGDSGEDATGSVEEELLGHCFVAPYCEHDSSLCFTLTVSGVPSGYIVGTADTLAFARWAEDNWWPPLRERYAGVDVSSLSVGSRSLIADIRKGLSSPGFSVDYPAHLHINLLPIAQGGNGSRMMDVFIGALIERGVKAVHLGLSPANHRALHFYKKYGMHEISRNGSIFMGLHL